MVAVLCDICENKISPYDNKYTIKKSRCNIFTGMLLNASYDICEDCYNKLVNMVKENKNDDTSIQTR